LAAPAVVNWPQNGWQLYPSLGTGNGAGSIFYVDQNQVITEVMDLELEPPKPTLDSPRRVSYEEKSTLGLNLFGRYVLGRGNLAFGKVQGVSVDFQTSGTERIIRKWPELEDAALRAKIPERYRNSDKTLWVRAEVETAREVRFVLNQEALSYFGGDVSAALAAEGNGGLRRYITNKNVIVVSSPEPLNIAFKAMPISFEQQAEDKVVAKWRRNFAYSFPDPQKTKSDSKRLLYDLDTFERELWLSRPGKADNIHVLSRAREWLIWMDHFVENPTEEDPTSRIRTELFRLFDLPL